MKDVGSRSVRDGRVSQRAARRSSIPCELDWTSLDEFVTVTVDSARGDTVGRCVPSGERFFIPDAATVSVGSDVTERDDEWRIRVVDEVGLVVEVACRPTVFIVEVV